MPQSYKVFIGHGCVHLTHHHYEGGDELKDGIKAKIEYLALHGSVFDFYLNWTDGPEAFFRRYFSGCRMHEAAGGLVFDRHRRLLVMIRHGIPDFPKGHLDSQEQPHEAALREVSEETGLNRLEIFATAPETWHAYQQSGIWHLKRTRWFLMSTRNDYDLKPQLEEGITELVWAGSNDIEGYLAATYRSLREILKPVIDEFLIAGTYSKL